MAASASLGMAINVTHDTRTMNSSSSTMTITDGTHIRAEIFYFVFRPNLNPVYSGVNPG